MAGAANLRTSHLDSIAAIQQVAEGKNAMPAFKGQLSDEEIGQVVHYVVGLRK
jgi:mono/diheme cytochrome c family protein